MARYTVERRTVVREGAPQKPSVDGWQDVVHILAMIGGTTVFVALVALLRLFGLALNAVASWFS